MNSSRPSWTPGFFLATCGVATLLSTGAALATVLLLQDSPPGVAANDDPRRGDDLEAELRELADTVRHLEQRVQELQIQRLTIPAEPTRQETPRETPRAPRGSVSVAAAEDRPERAPGMNGKLRELMQLRGPEHASERLALARQILADPGAMGRMMALQVLIELAPTEALTELRSMIQTERTQDSRAGVWDRAFQSLAGAEGIDAAAEFHSLYQIGDTEVKGAAARALRQLGDESLMTEYLTGIEAGLRSPDVQQRLISVEQLSRNGGDRTQELILPLLSDESPEVRLRVLDSLVVRQGPETTSHIEALEQDPDERVRRRASRMLEMRKARQRMLDERGIPPRDRDG